MKATVDRDIVISLHNGDIEVGVPPSGVGIERLRWDGARLVDLAGLSTIYVEVVDGSGFVLHAVPVAGSTPIEMAYRDRHRLSVAADGSPYLASTEEAEQRRRQNHQRERIGALAQRQRERIGDIETRLLLLYQLVAVLMVAQRRNIPALDSYLDELVACVIDAVPTKKAADRIAAALTELKKILVDYYDDEDKEASVKKQEVVTPCKSAKRLFFWLL